jgi:hypothetical protein
MNTLAFQTICLIINPKYYETDFTDFTATKIGYKLFLQFTSHLLALMNRDPRWEVYFNALFKNM